MVGAKESGDSRTCPSKNTPPTETKEAKVESKHYWAKTEWEKRAMSEAADLPRFTLEMEKNTLETFLVLTLSFFTL